MAESALAAEAALLGRLIHHFSHQHASSQMLRLMTALSRLLSRAPGARERILATARRLYCSCTGALVRGHFVAHSVTVLAVAARIYYLVERDKGNKGNRGDKGNKGDRDDKRDRSDKGDRGDKRDRGNKGSKGNKDNKSKTTDRMADKDNIRKQRKKVRDEIDRIFGDD